MEISGRNAAEELFVGLLRKEPLRSSPYNLHAQGHAPDISKYCRLEEVRRHYPPRLRK
jgi:hypothetical protein